MIMRKLLFIFLLFLFFCGTCFSQQSAIYSQYVLNEFIINPSVAGIDGMTTINFTARKQWIGVENAPNTYSASISTRLLKTNNAIIERFNGPNKFRKGASGKVGLGASLLSDQNAAISRIGLNMTYAYHIFIDNSQLSFGLSFLMQQFKIDRELAKFADVPGQIDPTDELIGKSAYIPDAAFGINYSAKYFSTGISAFQLFQSPVKFGNIEADYKQLKQVRHYIATGLYHNTMRNNPEWEYEPSIIIRSTENLQSSADISLRFIYKKEYWAGFSFRTSGDFILLMGLKLSRFYFGYSFDYGFNEISRLSYGSHEIMLALKLGDSVRRYRYWERY
jgi:type IX secretion system PorP/SprF family membrane protein